VVTEKKTNLIDTYTVGADGLLSAPVSTPSNGSTPFGFAFDNSNHLIVSEAFGGAPNQAAVSSYTVSGTSTLNVARGSVPDLQTAACWVVITRSGRFAYTSNTGSDSISSYQIGENGTLTLLASVAASTGSGSAPIDMAFNKNTQLLYVIASGSHMVQAFQVGSDGSLTAISGVSDLPAGAQGIAAR
jgi:6-phosphogluconolactonase